MFIFFEPSTRRVTNVVTYAPENYRQFLEANPSPDEDWVETQDDYRFEEIEVNADKTVSRRQPMLIDGPSSVTTGAAFLINDVPEGVSILVNGELMGTMDDSGALEFTAETGGLYHFRFEGSGYITKELTVEAVG